MDDRRYTDLQLLRSLMDGAEPEVAEQAVLNVLTVLYENGETVPRASLFDALAQVYSGIWSFGDE